MNPTFDGFYAESYRLLTMVKGAPEARLDKSLAQYLYEVHARNPPGEGHWEFLSTALVDTFTPTLGKPLEPNLRRLLRHASPHLGQSHHTTNWRLMQRIAACALDQRPLTERDLEEIRLTQASDGLLWDTHEDRSTQYHAYLLLLILRFAEPTPSLQSRVQASFDWLANTCTMFGDPSPLGRGRFQSFGYASMAAAIQYSKPWEVQLDRGWTAQVIRRLPPEQPNGSLASDWTGPHRTALLHGYNTSQDYRAFGEFWLKGFTGFTGMCNREQGLWWHPLDFAGHGLIADSRGVQAALLPPRTPVAMPDTFGLREGLTLLRSVIQTMPRRMLTQHPTRYRQENPSTITPGFKHSCGSSTLQYDGNTFRFSMEVLPSSGTHVLFSPTLWLRAEHGFDSWETTGSLETESLMWSRPGLASWVGRGARIVRKGCLECHFTTTSGN